MVCAAGGEGADALHQMQKTFAQIPVGDLFNARDIGVESLCENAVVVGDGMGIHIAASKCPHVHAGVVESVPAALRAITGNGVNVLAMGAFYVAPQTACDIADAYLSNELGSGWEWWHNFYEFHKLAIDELEAFDYEEYKKNGFKVNKLGDYDLTLDFDKKPE